MAVFKSNKNPTFTAILFFVFLMSYCLFYYGLYVYFNRKRKIKKIKKIKNANTSPICLVDVDECPEVLTEMIELPVAKTIEFHTI